MNCEDTTIQPWVNSTENASSSRDESSPIRDTNDNGRADRRNARSPPAVQPTAGAGSSRGESPGRAEDETSDSGEFELERKMFELERRKVEIEIALAQCVLARKRCRERATQAVRGQQTGDIDPMLRDLAANMAEVGVNGVREHGGCTAMAANRQRHPRATRMEDSGATRQPETIAPLTAVGYPGLLNATLATIAPLTAAEQPGPSHTTAAATDHYEPEYISWRRAVDERYRLGSTNCTTHGRAMEGDNAGVRDEDGADTRTRKHFDSIGHCYTHSGLDGVLLRYVPVVLHGRGTNVQTFALLDDGSTSTFMDHDLMGELGLRGTLRPLCLNWTGDTVREEVDSVEVDIEISGVHHATDLLISDIHERYCHINHRTVVNQIRSKFHIPKLLVELNRVRRACQLCRIWNATPVPPLMGNIPRQRMGIAQRPFTYCGVDYFGPMSVVVGRRTEKRWGVIFTCLTVRAVHLEVAHALTTASCIMAVRRFIASRGSPIEIISDRGTNFVGASKELSAEFNSPTLKWSFNPPGAPHFGGCWERLIQSVKRALSKMNIPRVPNDETLVTTLKEIELIINSRPLTYVPLDNEDASPITPNHILLGTSNGNKPPVKLDDSASAVRMSWRATQQNADQFWTLWVKDFLPTLTRRTKWFQPTRPIEVGDVVILVDNNLPRNCWPKGRVLEVTLAKDGQVRKASVKTVNGVYERPATKIAVIDVGARDSNVRGDATEI